MIKKLLLILFFTGTGILHPQSIRTISFYPVKFINENPVIDGKLNEKCWKKCIPATEFYQYWKTNPGKSELKTEFRMFYNKRGLYLGITNYDKYVDNIKATKIKRDDPDLWRDDCEEIYFDPEAKAVGYVRFVVNFLGTKYDSRRYDSANIDESWNGEGWYYRTSKGKDFWMIEIFFPWSDLTKKAEEGEIWMFDMVRYSWSTGKFRGATWSPEGSYNTPEKFGYLYFTKDTISREKLGKLLSKNVSPPWQLPLENGFIVCTKKNKFSFYSVEEIINKEKRKIEKAIERTQSIVEKFRGQEDAIVYIKKFDENREEFKSIKNISVSPFEIKKVLTRMNKIYSSINQTYWELKILELF